MRWHFRWSEASSFKLQHLHTHTHTLKHTVCPASYHQTNSITPCKYGTAGYRGDAHTMSTIAIRVGCLACLRSMSFNSDRASIVGIMITASHNPETDNGFKYIDPSGEMMDSSWESIGDELINTDQDKVSEFIQQLVQIHQKDSALPRIAIGYDTRDSSLALCELLKRSVQIMSGQCVIFGLVTTPQMHCMVREINSKHQFDQMNANRESIELARKAYITTIASNFKQAMELFPGRNDHDLIVDCANGVGAYAMQCLQELLKLTIVFQLINTNDGRLNHQVGADHVHKNKCLPQGMDKVQTGIYANCNVASLDGDADRLVFCGQIDGKFHLLDGDKMSVLLATFLASLLHEAHINEQVSIGVVQTAYANGASTQYIRDVLQIPIVCTQTGVKFLHQAAKQFDIGIYFESNGHGTLLFHEKTVSLLESLDHPSVQLFKCISRIANQCVGDGICDLLLCRLALSYQCWNLKQWNELYYDWASLSLTVEVEDRSIIKCASGNDQLCIEPFGLQTKIDQLMQRYSSCRIFVRPSGTENVVRIYIETQDVESIKQIGVETTALVKNFQTAK